VSYYKIKNGLLQKFWIKLKKIIFFAFYFSFFQKLGAAAASTRLTRSQLNSSRSAVNNSSSKSYFLNPLSYFSRSSLSRPKKEINPDSMLIRYTLLTATCITVAFLLIKLINR
jgi:hypothetical protein